MDIQTLFYAFATVFMMLAILATLIFIMLLVHLFKSVTRLESTVSELTQRAPAQIAAVLSPLVPVAIAAFVNKLRQPSEK